MRDYGRIHCAFWCSQDIRVLSDDGKLLALYLLSCPHGTIIGAFRLPDGYASEDLGWPQARVSKGFKELFAKGWANRCETSKWVWIRRFLSWNLPENPNQWKAARKLIAQIPPQCSWVSEFTAFLSTLESGEIPSKGNGYETLGEGLPNQEQEQEQEQEQNRDREPARSARGPRINGKHARGIRLPADFSPDLAYGSDRAPDLDASIEFEKFKNYWTAKPGNAGTKLDWEATWRSWILNGIDRGSYARKQATTRRWE